ncbi:MAG: CRISPR-associated CARF protein Csa3 [Candidatus Methanosuratincola petrocarbonis]
MGFDEKFAMRSIIRNGLQDRDEIYVVLPEGGDPRAEKAFSNLKEFVDKAFNNIKIERVYVPVENFAKTVNRLRLFLRRVGVGDKIINLSGGQRVLIVALLIAASSLDLDLDVEIETEDSKLVNRFPISLMKAQNLDQIDLKILEYLSKNTLTIGELSTIMDISRATVWRRLEKLIAIDFVEKMDKGEYRVSDAGRSMID